MSSPLFSQFERLDSWALDVLLNAAWDCQKVASEIMRSRGELVLMFPEHELEYHNRMESGSNPVVGIFVRKQGIEEITKLGPEHD
jgi:hypothetical protein